MMNEWRELKTLQDVAEAQKNDEEIEVDVERRGKYVAWSHVGWDSEWNFRSRPKRKAKLIVLREALFCCDGMHHTLWCNEDYVDGMLSFVKWLDTPERIVEVEEND